MIRIDVTLTEPGHRFINEVADWLLLTRDSRMQFLHSGARINDVMACCADFCEMMVQCTESGYGADWRRFVMSEKVQVSDEDAKVRAKA